MFAERITAVAPLLQQQRRSQGLQVKPGLCKAGFGNQMETRIPRVDTACPTREPQQDGPALNQSLGDSSAYFPVGSTLWVSTHSLIMLNSLSQPQEEPQLRTGYIIKISTSEKLLFMRWIVRTTNRMVWVGRDLQDPRAQVLWPWLLQGISIWDWTLRVIYVLTWYLSNCLDFISPSSPNTSLATHPSC